MTHKMIRRMITVAVAIFCMEASAAQVRIKDVARVAGMENMNLIGYGIVVGLKGTGDKDLTVTKTTMANLLENFNLKLEVNDIKSKNSAAVMITALIPPFHAEGDKIDVEVASIGDAQSLEGGILLMTPLLDPNGDLYAMAQGSITLGGFSAGKGDAAGGNSVEKNHATTGLVLSGGLIKKNPVLNFCQNGIIKLILRNADFTTASRMAMALNKEFGGMAVAKDANTVAVSIPSEALNTGQTAAFISKIELVRFISDTQSKVVVNERTGTIVMGGDVNISAAVVAHGNLTVTVKETLNVSQPTNLILANRLAGPADIRTEVTPDVKTEVNEEKARITLIPETTSVRELADTLQLMGATPRDMISILGALHRLGALQMEFVSM